jgi:hypothetical protein
MYAIFNKFLEVLNETEQGKSSEANNVNGGKSNEENIFSNLPVFSVQLAAEQLSPGSSRGCSIDLQSKYSSGSHCTDRGV